MRSKLVVGNWKLNGSLEANAALLAGLKAGFKSLDGATLGVCVPAPYFQQVGAALAGSAIAWGGQDASRFESGAYTGEVSARMLADCKAHFCIVGHSERRAIFGDSDAAVAEKFGRVKAAGLVPIACVGETLEQREAGNTAKVVLGQVEALLAAHGQGLMQDAVLAYEPVWAIGTGRTASKEQAQEVHALIRARLGEVDAGLSARMPILYGGSVKAGNAKELFGMPDIDGGLVGGASLVAEEFLGIWAALGSR